MAAYLYTGTGERPYADYVDSETGKMLIAEPGGSYTIRATWDVLPVPPSDGFWEEPRTAVKSASVKAIAAAEPAAEEKE